MTVAQWRSVGGKLHSVLLNESPHYYTHALVMPDNENEYFPFHSISVQRPPTEDRLRDRSVGRRQPDMWPTPKIQIE